MKTVCEKIDPQLAEALAVVPKAAARIFDLNDIEGTRTAIHEMADAALGRVGLPDDIGGVVAFLRTKDAKWING
jgi:hypothetical protein